MSMKKSIVLVATAMALAAGAAAAGTITFEFTGTVTYSTYMALPGSPVTGTFTYNIENMSPQKQQALYGGPVANYTTYAMPAPAGIAGRVGDHAFAADNLTVSVFNDWGGNVGDMVDVFGSSVVVDGTTYASGALGFGLATTPGNTEVFKDTRLPRNYKVGDFDGMNSGALLTDGGSTGMVLQFTIDSIGEVPTPGQ